MSSLFSFHETGEKTGAYETTYSEVPKSESHEFDYKKPETSYVELENMEKRHCETKQDVLKEYGQYMDEDQVNRIKSTQTVSKLNLVSAETYTNKFPQVSFETIGHCDMEGNVYIKNISPEITRHTIVHETMHQCSFREARPEGKLYTYQSGIKEITYNNETGKINNVANVGVNEGLTEMYTKRNLLEHFDTEGCNCLNCYTEAVDWSKRMEFLVGKEVTARAYFGGEVDELKEKFIRLNSNDENAWDEFSHNVDVLTRGGSLEDVNQAKKSLGAQFIRMYENSESQEVKSLGGMRR